MGARGGGHPRAHAQRLGGDPVRTSGAFAGGRRAVAPPGRAARWSGRLRRPVASVLCDALLSNGTGAGVFPRIPVGTAPPRGPRPETERSHWRGGRRARGRGTGARAAPHGCDCVVRPGLPFPAVAPAAVASLSLKVALSREMSCRSAARRPELAVSSLHLLTTPASPPLTV